MIAVGHLEDRGAEESRFKDKPGKRDDYEHRIDIFNAADQIFRFFLPWRVSNDAPTVGKFWAAVQNLIEASCPPWVVAQK